MGKIPVWAMGYALRLAGVPCAEEIAMMLKVETPIIPDTPKVATYNWNDFSSSSVFGEFSVGEIPLNLTNNASDSIIGRSSADTHLPVVPPAYPQSGRIELIFYFPKYEITGVESEVEYLEYAIFIAGEPVSGTGFTSTHATYRVDTGELQIYRGVFTYSGALEDESVEALYENGDVVGMKVHGKVKHPINEIEMRTYTPFAAEQNAGYTVTWKFSHDNPFIMKVYD